jgi:histidinol-phosphatase (PHP family)
MEAGFAAIGFSDHGFTEYDLRYCMKDRRGYIKEIRRLKEKFKGRIQIYTGVEEDAFSPLSREDFDYLIGSCHYIEKDGRYFPIDSNRAYFQTCLSLFNNDALALAEAYYSRFCDYICRRKPDIIGHFDLITKFDELDESLFLKNPGYTGIAETYILEAIRSGCIFEVNTGAMARGLRSSPYPYENLLYILRKNRAAIILSSDSHCAETLAFQFEETRLHLREIGFDKLTVLADHAFREIHI